MRAASAVIRHLRDEPFAAVGGVIYVIILVMALFASQFAPYDPRAILREGRRIARYLPISRDHWLRTTAGGHDVLSQLIFGSRSALEVGLTAALAVVAIGTLLGLLAGYLGGWVDKLVTRIADIEIPDSKLPPLPVTSFPAARPMDVVNAVFKFAARRPDVLSKVPCFCGCERMGHRGNDDCFVKSRDARGVPTEWEEHGLG